MKFTNHILLNFHFVYGYCEHCHAKRSVYPINKAQLKKYHGPFCEECGHKLDI